jgi:TPR repeat protein
MLVVLSPASIASQKVKNEFIHALDQGKGVIPVLFRECKIPMQLKRLQYADFRADYATGIDELLTSLGSHLTDSETRLRELQRRAESGDADAMVDLAQEYSIGETVTQDQALAFDWFRKAANVGNPTAMCGLVTLYNLGSGVAQSYADAVFWFRKAAEIGNAEGMFNLAYVYEFGEGVPQDYDEARKWYTESLRLGRLDADAALERIAAKEAAEQKRREEEQRRAQAAAQVARLEEERKQAEEQKARHEQLARERKTAEEKARQEQEERKRQAAEEEARQETERQRTAAEQARLEHELRPTPVIPGPAASKFRLQWKIGAAVAAVLFVALMVYWMLSNSKKEQKAVTHEPQTPATQTQPTNPQPSGPSASNDSQAKTSPTGANTAITTPAASVKSNPNTTSPPPATSEAASRSSIPRPSWQPQISGTQENLSSVAFVSPQSGWAVGERGTILHTADGGRSWQPQTSGTKETLLSVAFVSPQSGWALGRGSTILHTADGGTRAADQRHTRVADFRCLCLPAVGLGSRHWRHHPALWQVTKTQQNVVHLDGRLPGVV